jgi:hypothetical protein
MKRGNFALSFRITFISLMMLFVVLFILPLCFATPNSSVEMTVGADILKTVASATINSSIYFGSLMKGFASDDVRVDVVNTGTTNITITPRLESADTIFDNLFLKRRSADTPTKIGSFSMTIPKPTTMGGTSKDYFYMNLDLTSFSGSIDADMMNHQKKVIVWIMPQE